MVDRLDRLIKLEEKQQVLRDSVTQEDKINWRSSSLTKALLLQLDIDDIQNTENWKNGVYQHGDTEAEHRGKSNYADSIAQFIDELGASHDYS